MLCQIAHVLWSGQTAILSPVHMNNILCYAENVSNKLPKVKLFVK